MILPDIQSLQKFISLNDIASIENLLNSNSKQKSDRILKRSYLMLSAHNLKHLNKIDQLDADVIMLNLEDGVSKEQKPLALNLARLAVQNATKEQYIVVRVNPLQEGGIEEIKKLCPVKPDAIRVPKIYNHNDVEQALKLIDDDIKLHLSIETKEAFNQITSLKIDPRVTTFYLGILDLFADMKMPQEHITLHNPTLHYILSKFLIDCKIAQVDAVGFTYQKHRDIEGFRKWCELERLMGYESKSCISPTQVEVVNEIFLNDQHLQRAQKIVALFEDNHRKGITGFDDDELGFIDEPIYKDACNILKKRANNA